MDYSEMSLSEAINSAVSEWSAANDGAICASFIFAGEFIEESGSNSIAATASPNSSLSGALGLAVYFQEFFMDLHREGVLGVLYGSGEGE